MTLGLINANPVVQEKKERTARANDDPHGSDASSVDALDVFDILFVTLKKNLNFFFALFYLLFGLWILDSIQQIL